MSPFSTLLPLLGSLVVQRLYLGRCCSNASAPCVPGQGRGAAGVTREGLDISGDIAYLLNAPERKRGGNEGRGIHHCVKPAEVRLIWMYTSPLVDLLALLPLPSL